jgi:hypothetical protein
MTWAVYALAAALFVAVVITAAGDGNGIVAGNDYDGWCFGSMRC